jgi:translation initiation factor IF-2
LVKDKVRIYALAKTLGVDSKIILDHCVELGIEAKNQLSNLEQDQADLIETRIKQGSKPKAEPAKLKVAAAPASLPAPPRKIVNLPGPKTVVKETPVEAAVPSVELPELPAVPEPVVEVAPTPPPAVVVEIAKPVEQVIKPVEPVIEAAPAIVAEPVHVAEPVKHEVLEEPIPSVVAPPVIAELEVIPEVEIPEIEAEISIAEPAAPVMASPEVKKPHLNPLQSAQKKIISISNNRPKAAPAPAKQPVPATPTPAVPAAATAASSPTNAPVAATPAPSIQPRPAPTGAPIQQRSKSPREVLNESRGGNRTGGGGPANSPNRPGVSGPAGGMNRSGPGGNVATPGGKPGDKKPAPPPPTPTGPKKFSPDELRALREGISVAELIRRQNQTTQAQNLIAKPVVPLGKDGQPEEEEGDKKRGPGGGKGGPPANDQKARQADRKARAEKRKARETVVVSNGQVEVIEEGYNRRGRRPKPKLRQPGTVERKGKVPIDLPITVRTLSEASGIKVAELVFKLKDLTQSLFTINSSIDIETAQLIAIEKGIELEIRKARDFEEEMFESHAVDEDETKLISRAPIVTIMGHVDHGKTSLLDKIRSSNVVSGEAGGITQVIRAWRVLHNDKPITFLDTPGHEAFTKMRARGANVTDIVVIVVAAPEGVQPQTEEAIAHAKAAEVDIIVAINKVDLPNANLNRTRQQLYSLGLLPDTMGGDIPFVETSAVTGLGVEELLESILLVAELADLKANPNRTAAGTCLEAYLSEDEGVMATLLVQNGTLRKGDVVLCGAAYGRVRAMYNDMGKPILEAGPSVPVRITGLDEVPNADDHFHVVSDMAQAREIGEKRKDRQQTSNYTSREAVKLENVGQTRKLNELKIVLKAEARGSVEAIRKELEKLVHDEVRVRVLYAGIGGITESDVQLALASPEDTIIVGFNVVPDDAALKMAEERDVPIREYDIIYKLTEDIKQALEGKLKPREEVIHLGRAVVREVFKISKVGTVAGCYVTQGTIERSGKIRVIRSGAVIYPAPEKTAGLDSLKRFKDDVREVREGYDCGIKVAGYDDLKVDDVIEAYRIEQRLRTLDSD